MIKLIGKIALMTVLSISMLGAKSAMGSAQYLDKQSTSTISSPDKFSSFNTTFASDIEEEVEKMITNVKVFYNPVAEQVTVTFKLSKQNTVSIKVMDALGSEVLNLANASMDAGVQNLSYETNSKLTAGVYFVRVTSGAETVVKRISVR